LSTLHLKNRIFSLLSACAETPQLGPHIRQLHGLHLDSIFRSAAYTHTQPRNTSPNLAAEYESCLSKTIMEKDYRSASHCETSWLKYSFWFMNIGLFSMSDGSLLPVGLKQTGLL
jgi:hypothetical protein